MELNPGWPRVSVLGMGCAAMMGSAGQKQSVAALRAALDAGVNFFDTARSYGYGASESLVGQELSGRRHEVVICTKFGILPAPRSWRQAVMPVARGVLKLFPGLRGAARRQAGQMFTENQFSVPLLRASFETSLRELRTDYIDILLMHSAPPSVLDQHDLLRELERLVAEGKVRMVGISGDLPTIERTFAEPPTVVRTAQFACNLGNFPFLDRTAVERAAGTRHAAFPPMFLVGNHPFGGPAGVAATRARIAELAADSQLGRGLRTKLDVQDPLLLPDLILNSILTGVDALIPAMLNLKHLANNCRVVGKSRFTADELVGLRGLLAGGVRDLT